jgi:hypothetical protein
VLVAKVVMVPVLDVFGQAEALQLPVLADVIVVALTELKETEQITAIIKHILPILSPRKEMTRDFMRLIV